MHFNATTVLRRGIIALWLVLLAAITGYVLVSRLAPFTGQQLIVIRGGSMEPTIPRGSIVTVRAGPSAEIGPGDVVTLRLGQDGLLTHRVLRVATLPDGIYLETKGDANAEPDPVLVPAASALGVVNASLPIAGYVIAFLTLPTGMVSAVSLLTSLLLTALLLEEPRPTGRRAQPVRAPTLRSSGI